jgi:hypothetical protein
MQPLDVDAASGPPDGAQVVHHKANELLVQQDSIPDRGFIPVQETQKAHPMGSTPADLFDVGRPPESFVLGHPT